VKVSTATFESAQYILFRHIHIKFYVRCIHVGIPMMTRSSLVSSSSALISPRSTCGYTRDRTNAVVRNKLPASSIVSILAQSCRQLKTEDKRTRRAATIVRHVDI
jgi:hypothetical protein